MQVSEWIIGFAHPDAFDEEEWLPIADEVASGALFTYAVPSPATAVSALAADASLPLSGDLVIASSAGEGTVTISNTMSYSDVVQQLTTLPGVHDVDVAPFGNYRRGLTFELTFPPESYALGTVPRLLIASHSLVGALLALLGLTRHSLTAMAMVLLMSSHPHTAVCAANAAWPVPCDWSMPGLTRFSHGRCGQRVVPASHRTGALPRELAAHGLFTTAMGAPSSAAVDALPAARLRCAESTA